MVRFNSKGSLVSTTSGADRASPLPKPSSPKLEVQSPTDTPNVSISSKPNRPSIGRIANEKIETGFQSDTQEVKPEVKAEVNPTIDIQETRFCKNRERRRNMRRRDSADPDSKSDIKPQPEVSITKPEEELVNSIQKHLSTETGSDSSPSSPRNSSTKPEIVQTRSEEDKIQPIPKPRRTPPSKINFEKNGNSKILASPISDEGNSDSGISGGPELTVNLTDLDELDN